MTVSQYRQHISDKLKVQGNVRLELEECHSKKAIREVLRRHDFLSPVCQAQTRPVYQFGKTMLVKCGKAVTIWWDHDLGVPVCKTCAAKLNSSGTQRCTRVPSKKRKAS